MSLLDLNVVATSKPEPQVNNGVVYQFFTTYNVTGLATIRDTNRKRGTHFFFALNDSGLMVYESKLEGWSHQDVLDCRYIPITRKYVGA